MKKRNILHVRVQYRVRERVAPRLAVSTATLRVGDVAPMAAPQGLPVVRRALLQRAYFWFRLLHPFPSLLVTAATVVFALLASRGHLAPPRLLLVGLVMLCAQGAIGSANDAMDHTLDAATKPWKPVARGAISIRAAAVSAAVLSLLSLCCAVLLGPAVLPAAAAGLACGLLYDVRLKRTRWSWLPYGLALPTLPVFAWTAAGHFTPRLLLVYPLGVLLGLALHLANTLPDLEGDHAFGVRGLTHTLGMRRALILCYGSIILAQLLTLLLASVLRYHGPWYPAGFAFSLLLTGVAALLYRLRPTAGSLQINFGVLALAVISLALGWLGSAVA